ncbi:MAG: matrixin family metalloprotease [Pseudomonadota bacterium]
MKTITVSRKFLTMLALAAALFVATTVQAQIVNGAGTPAAVTGMFTLGPSVPGKWGPPELGTGATVTWGLMPSGVSCAAEFAGCTTTALSAFMPNGYLTQISAAFDAWASVANLRFIQGVDNGVPVNALTGTSVDIRIGGEDMSLDTLAHSYFPPVYGNTIAGDIHFNQNHQWKTTIDGSGYWIFSVALHEIGHALGLAHTDLPDTVMYSFYTEDFTGLQAGDIAGIQTLYGARIAIVPIPATLMLMMAGVLAMAGVRRRS